MSTATTVEWIDAVQAASILGIEPRQVRQVEKHGALSVRTLPGVRARYRRDEVERLARECVRSTVSK